MWIFTKLFDYFYPILLVIAAYLLQSHDNSSMPYKIKFAVYTL